MTSFVRPLRGGFIENAVRLSHFADVTVSVVMVVYRTGPALQESLRRVLADPLVDEFIIVENGATDAEVGWIDAAAGADTRVTVLRGQGNVGFARGANMGVEASHGRTIVILNPDAFLDPGCIPALTAALHHPGEPEIRLVGARVMNEDGTEQRGARRGEVTASTTFFSLTRLSNLPWFREYEIHHEHDNAPTESVRVPTISGACFAVRRDHFVALGGFDTGFFLHVEDVDLCWRVRKSGGEVLFCPQAQVTHLGSTSHTHPVKVEFHKGLGLVRYFAKRAETTPRRLLAYALGGPILAVSVMRPLLRRLAGAGWLR
jgi:hypothetical protein